MKRHCLFTFLMESFGEQKLTNVFIQLSVHFFKIASCLRNLCSKLIKNILLFSSAVLKFHFLCLDFEFVEFIFTRGVKGRYHFLKCRYPVSTIC